MTTIAELIPTNALDGHEVGEGAHERVRDVPHPFWGDPPDVETCQEWMSIVLGSANRCQEELSFATKGGRITDEHQRPLSQLEYAAWRREKVGEWHRKMARYRMLKAWRIEADRARATSPKEMTQRAYNGGAIKAAVKRYGQLENVFEALTAWLADDTDETWSGLLEAVEHVEKTNE